MMKSSSIKLGNLFEKKLTLPQPSGSSSTTKIQQDIKLPTTSPSWMAGFEKNSSGGLILRNKELIKRQQGIIKSVIAQIGASLLSGKLNVSLSLPIALFEPKSALQRVAESWAYAPSILSKAANTDSSNLERLKHVMAFVISTLHLCVGQEKPFNPLLGETYEACFSDGTTVFMEHTSHHPSVLAFQVIKPKVFEFTGAYELLSTMKGNSIVNHQAGNSSIKFSDGYTVSFTLPSLRITGLVLGSRVVEWIGDIKFSDNQNLKSHLSFVVPSYTIFKAITTSFSSNSSNNVSGKSDVFTGTIITDKSQNDAIVSTVSGSWQESIVFDNNNAYWDVEKNSADAEILIPVSNPLPSDCRFRADLKALAAGDTELAQSAKLQLEEAQRADARLRKG